MQALARLSVNRPVVATVIILVLTVMGFFAYSHLGVDRFPNVDFPVVTVTTTLKGATPEEIETQVTEEIEKQINTVSGIETLQSNSAEGVSVVTVQFNLEKNGDVAAQEVRAKVDLALPNLPEQTDKPVVQKFDTTGGTVVSFTLSSPNASIRELTEYADKKLRPQVESLSGVGEIQIVGGRLRQINVMVDPNALRAYDLTVIDVRNALQAQNLQVPGGALDEGQRRLSVRTQGRVQSMAELENLVVKVKAGQPIRIKDVAHVEDSEEEAETIANVNGRPAVLLNVRKQSGSNTVAVIDAVKERVKLIQSTLPKGYETKFVTDQSTFIKAALHAVQEHLVLGAVLAAIIVLVFLWNWRSTIIAAIAIPTSLIATFALMSFMGFTLNVITLLALTLAVGIVIDDAIIVLENIYRFIQEKKMTPREAAIEATQEIGLAVLATTLSLVAVFLPVAFMSGIVGRFLNSFGMTMAFSILVSLVVAFTLTPMLSARWLKRPKETTGRVLKGEGLRGAFRRKRSPGHTLAAETDVQNGTPQAEPVSGHGHSGGFFTMFENAYAAVLRFFLRRRWIVVVGSVAVFFSMGPIGSALNKGFLPDDDQSQYVLSVRAPEGTSLASTEQLLNKVASDIRKLPEVRYTVITAGDDPQQTQNLGTILVQMNEVEDRKTNVTQFDLMARTRKEILTRYPKELRTVVSPPNAFGSGAQAQIQYVISGPDLNTLIRAGERIAAELRKYPGAADADTSAVVGRPELGVTVDRNAAADLGVSVSDIATSLRVLVAGEHVSDYAENGLQYDINLRALPEYRSKESSLALFTIPSTKDDVKSVPVSQLVTTREGSGPSVVQRYARARQVTISANVKTGASQQAVQDQIAKLFADQKLGPLYRAEFIGQAKEMGRSFASFGVALLLALTFMYLILAAQFESWVYPVVILSSLPLTLPFALLSLLLLGQSLNIYSMLGILVLVAVVKKNAILQVDHTNGLRAQGMERNAAVVQACKDRLRPILMTTIAFVAGMIPLATSSGTGAGTNRATSGVIIGGQVMSLLLTLVAIPIFYTIMDDFVRGIDWVRTRVFRQEVHEGARAHLASSNHVEPEPVD